MGNIDEIFNEKLTENGDVSYTTTTNHLLDLLFMCEYFSNHLGEVTIGDSEREKLFSMFIRDPRYGLGYRDLGRILMHKSVVPMSNVVKAGRFDDLYITLENSDAFTFHLVAMYLYDEVSKGNELAKKWMPRYSSKHLMLARKLAKYYGMTKQQYGHFIKCNTVENKLSRKNINDIKFEHVPSKAMLKYYKRFSNKDDVYTSSRFEKYLEEVRNGSKKMNVSTTNVYDIYKNRENIDCDLMFSKIEKIAINCLPIVDTSSSMTRSDAMGKALAIGHYLAKCSTYMKDRVVEFSSHPHLIKLGEPIKSQYRDDEDFYCCNPISKIGHSQYLKELDSMYTGDCSNTDFGAVMELLTKLDSFPEYLIVLTDGEFDRGSKMKKDELEELWKEKGYTTKIVWWNFNAVNKTVPEVDSRGNIYMSGYSPMLLKYLEAGFDGNQFLDRLLKEYAKNIDTKKPLSD